MMSFSLWLQLSQHRMIVSGVLLTITITACNASPASQPLAANTSPIASPSSPITSPNRSPASPSARPSQQEAVQVIRDYYSAIARRDYEQAYLAC